MSIFRHPVPVQVKLTYGTVTQCFGTIFIEFISGSSQNSQSGSGRPLNLDPDLLFLNTICKVKII